MKPKTVLSVLLAATAALLLGACSTVPPVPAEPLRVGFTPNYPPICMERDGMPDGLEIDFAKALCKELGRPLELVELPWSQQIDTLLAGRIDIIMSGLTATPARSARVRFCTPYMSNPLVAMCRAQGAWTNDNEIKAGDASAPATPDELLSTTASVGVLDRTSAEAFVTHHFPHARIVKLSRRGDAPLLLMNRRIDYYVDDFAAIANLLSSYEAQLAFIPYPLQGQNLCWAFRPDQTEFRQQCDQILARWKKSGDLDKMLVRWMPYLADLQSE